jgi:hypothetical protein
VASGGRGRRYILRVGVTTSELRSDGRCGPSIGVKTGARRYLAAKLPVRCSRRRESVNPWRPGRIYPAKAPCRENSWLITGWKGCDRQEWSTSPTRADFAARIVSVGLIGVLPTAADLDGGLAQKSKRLSDRLKLGSRPKEFPNCNALP